MEHVDLSAGTGEGPLWGTATAELNATLLAFGPGRGGPDHVNDERDVLVVVVEGSATVLVDGVEHLLEAPAAAVIPKGTARRITAGHHGVRYLSAHRARPGLQIRVPPRVSDPG